MRPYENPNLSDTRMTLMPPGSAGFQPASQAHAMRLENPSLSDPRMTPMPPGSADASPLWFGCFFNSGASVQLA
jgi:hypothetical protein